MTVPKDRVCQMDGVDVAVVRPSHVYRCPCECHTLSQLDLFERHRWMLLDNEGGVTPATCVCGEITDSGWFPGPCVCVEGL